MITLVFSGLGLMVLAKRLTQRKVYKRATKDFGFEHLGTGEDEMSDLPTWTKDCVNTLSVDNDYEATRLHEALTIAWQALTDITNERCEKYHGDNAADAMRRIEQLGGTDDRQS